MLLGIIIDPIWNSFEPVFGMLSSSSLVLLLAQSWKASGTNGDHFGKTWERFLEEFSNDVRRRRRTTNAADQAKF